MKTETAVLDAPGAGPELLIHEWADNGECTNPEKITIDFGKKAGLRQCTVWLGAMPDGTWRWGGYFRSRIDKSATTQPCVTKSPAFPTRAGALKNALGVGLELFRGDADGTRAIAGFLGKLFPEDSLAPNAEREAAPAAPAAADSRPLPKPRFAELAVKSIDRNPEQARKDFLPGPMKEIADSIASVGLLEPIVVRKLLPDELGEFPEFAGKERFELIAGERRHRAFVMLERETIPCMIYEGLTRAQAAAPSIIENVQREGLNAIEEAAGYRDLMQRESLTQEQAAQRVGKSRPVIANALRILDVVEKVDRVGKLMREGKLTPAHAVALLAFKPDKKEEELFPNWPKVVAALADLVVQHGISTARLENHDELFDNSDGVADELLDELGEEIAIVADTREHGYQLPKEAKDHPAYFDSEEFGWLCFQPEHWQALVKEFKAEQRRKADAEREKEARKEEKAVKAGGAPALADLGNKVVDLENDDSAKEVAPLIPEALVSVAKGYDGKKVEVCADPKLVKKLQAAVAELRAQRLVALVKEAREKLAKVKKVGPRELAVLIFCAQEQDRFFCGELNEGYLAFDTKTLAKLAKANAAKTYFTFVNTLLDSTLEQAGEDGGDAPLTLIAWILDRPEIERGDTAAERKALLEQVKAQPWYRQEVLGEKLAPKSAETAELGIDDGAIEVTVTMSSHDNKARAGAGKDACHASCTASPGEAAKRAAAKYFDCDEADVALRVKASGEIVGNRPQIYYASLKPKPGLGDEIKAAKQKAPKTQSGRAIITDETRAQVKRMTEAGNTNEEMADRLGISVSSVGTIKKQLGLVKSR